MTLRYYLHDSPATDTGPARITIHAQMASYPPYFAAWDVYAYQWDVAGPWQIHDGIRSRIYGTYGESAAREELARIAARLGLVERDPPGGAAVLR